MRFLAKYIHAKLQLVNVEILKYGAKIYVLLYLKCMMNAKSLKVKTLMIKEICSWLPPCLSEEEKGTVCLRKGCSQ